MNSSLAMTLSPVASIAVLPFVNRSTSEDDEYFAEGLADELLSVLSKIKTLSVSARSSSFAFKGRDTPLPEIGRALKVQALLEGSVRKSGDRARISVQLVKASDGFQLWSETYDRTLDDIFAVQDDIAQSVVTELRVTFLGEAADPEASRKAMADVVRASRGRVTDPGAHRLYLLARHLADRWTRENLSKAIEYLKQALDRSPDFALAWVELSRACAVEGAQGWVPEGEAYRRAREAVEHALALEPDLPEGHAQVAWIRTVQWDWRGAEASFARALELAPGNAFVLRWCGGFAQLMGRFDQAVDLCRRAMEQDPLSAPACHNYGFALQAANRLADAKEAYRRALELAPQKAITHENLALVLLAQGLRDEALAEAEREPEEWARLFAVTIVQHDKGDQPSSDAAFRELVEKHAADSSKQIAEVHALRGDLDAAFDWLERSYAQRDGALCEIKTSLYLRLLHEDPRWGAFVRKMGFDG